MKSYLKPFLLVCLLLICSSSKISEKDETQNKVTVFLIGDSTCANKKPHERPETGWGEMLSLYFNSSVIIDNHAVNGQSTKSFIEEGRWKRILDKIQPGDYVFIQFGHNDANHTRANLFTKPEEEFKTNLMRYIKETREKSAHPIILTSIARRKFDKDGKIVSTLEEYTAMTRELVKSNNVPLIDMEKKTAHLLEELGYEGSKKLYMWVSKEDFPYLKTDKEDSTHTREKGAYRFAALVVEGLEELNIEDLLSRLKSTND